MGRNASLIESTEPERVFDAHSAAVFIVAKPVMSSQSEYTDLITVAIVSTPT